MNPRLALLPEPTVLCGFEQSALDPRDGLTLFGPFCTGLGRSIRVGLAGPPGMCRAFREALSILQGPVSDGDVPYRPPFPGFETVFGAQLGPEPDAELTIPDDSLKRALASAGRHRLVFETVSLYTTAIQEHRRTQEKDIDLWFVLVPEDVYQYCRPLSPSPLTESADARPPLSSREASKLARSPSVFGTNADELRPYMYKPDFRSQLKVRFLLSQTPTQIIRESTLDALLRRDLTTPPRRRVDKPSTIAWNMCSAAFYKSGLLPWKLGGVRSGVCYVGLVFRQTDPTDNPRTACCAAQMFLDSGDGVVFRGAVGPWYSPERNEYHLSADSATELMSLVVDSYRLHHGGTPTELFIHGRVHFDDAEWGGFSGAVPRTTRIVGVRIRRDASLKVYATGQYPLLRGTLFASDSRTAYLWTSGFMPRLRTYLGKEVPNPLLLDVCRGDTDVKVIAQDILSLTKLNYNACIYGDGVPVTLRFADAVGKVLTATTDPSLSTPPLLPFKYYI